MLTHRGGGINITEKKSESSFWDFTHKKRQFYMIDFSMVCLICLGLGAVIQLINPTYGGLVMGLAIIVVVMRAWDLWKGYQKRGEEKA